MYILFKNHPILGIGVALLLFFSPPTSPADATIEEKSILVVLSSDGEIHRAVMDHMAGVLQSQVPNSRVKVSSLTLQQGAEAELLNGLSRHPDLIVAIGTRATQAVLDAKTQQPLLSVLVPKSAYRRLTELADSSSPPNQTSAIYLDQPPERQITLARILLPKSETVGLLSGPSLERRSHKLRSAAKQYGLRLNVELMRREDNAADAIKRLLRTSELVLALHDPEALKPVTAKWLLYMAYQRRVPVIGFSRAYLKAGAVASVFSTPEQIGRQAGERLVDWVNNGDSMFGDPQYPRYFSVEFNKPVAESLEIRVPDDGEVMQRMRELLGGLG